VNLNKNTLCYDKVSRVTEFNEGGVHGFLHWPDEPSGDGLVLTHGAGSNCGSPLLVETAEAACAAGLTVLRCNLPFRQRRAYGPPTPALAQADRAGLRNAVATLHGIVAGPIFLGGHSYGGRQASILAAEEYGAAAALLLLSYPLHPPAKPQQLRTDHFLSLRTPALFIQGTRDTFATPAELSSAIGLIPAPKCCMLIEGAGHELGRGKIDYSATWEQLRRWI
jgi:predicted alpha/beta-hydrolase family hydrolase